RQLRLELAEDAELSVLGVGDVEVVLVASPPEERLASLDPLDVAGLHATPFQNLELGGAGVVAARSHPPHLSGEAAAGRAGEGAPARAAVGRRGGRREVAEWRGGQRGGRHGRQGSCWRRGGESPGPTLVLRREGDSDTGVRGAGEVRAGRVGRSGAGPRGGG